MAGYAEKRGSIITEAAVMLPVYIIAIVTLVYIVRICHTDIIVFSAAENEVRKACAQATAPVFTEAGQAAAAAGLEKSRFDVSWMPGGIAGGYDGIDSLYKVSFKYDTKIAVPAAFRDSIANSNISFCSARLCACSRSSASSSALGAASAPT